MFIILQCLTHCDYLHLQKISTVEEALSYLHLLVSTLTLFRNEKLLKTKRRL